MADFHRGALVWGASKQKECESVTNEEIVLNIQKGQEVNKNMLLLYNNNLAMIKKICALFTQHETMEDLLQTAFLSLYDAVKGYKSDVGTKFMTYAPFVLKQGLIRYVNECCMAVRLPERRQAQVIKYRKFCTDFALCNGRQPKEEELCQYLDIDKKELSQIQKYALAPESLDMEYAGEEDAYTLADTISDGTDVAEETCKRIADEQIWEIIKETLPEECAQVIKARYLDNLTYKQTAEIVNLSPEKCRQIEHVGIRKLSFGKARAKLQRQLEHEYGSRVYKNGKYGFDIHFSSQVERLALRTLEIKDEFSGVKDSIYR